MRGKRNVSAGEETKQNESKKPRNRTKGEPAAV
jgi:hypothetical protein